MYSLAAILHARNLANYGDNHDTFLADMDEYEKDHPDDEGCASGKAELLNALREADAALVMLDTTNAAAKTRAHIAKILGAA